jgi:hypothetical protein
MRVEVPIVLYQPAKRARTDYRVGLSAWTDKSMLEEGHFYPYKTMSAEERLWWYSRFFEQSRSTARSTRCRRLTWQRFG